MPISDNNGSVFYNTDFSKSFNQTIGTGFTKLSAHVCSEVLIINRTGDDLYIYDNNNFSDTNRLLVLDDESIVLRGISNSDSVSARVGTTPGVIYWRAQMYSNMNQR